jgi:hypothetical protein
LFRDLDPIRWRQLNRNLLADRDAPGTHRTSRPGTRVAQPD